MKDFRFLISNSFTHRKQAALEQLRRRFVTSKIHDKGFFFQFPLKFVLLLWIRSLRLTPFHHRHDPKVNPLNIESSLSLLLEDDKVLPHYRRRAIKVGRNRAHLTAVWRDEIAVQRESHKKKNRHPRQRRDVGKLFLFAHQSHKIIDWCYQRYLIFIQDARRARGHRIERQHRRRRSLNTKKKGKDEKTMNMFNLSCSFSNNSTSVWRREKKRDFKANDAML